MQLLDLLVILACRSCVLWVCSVLPKNDTGHGRRAWPVVTSKLLVSFFSHIKQKSVLKACALQG